MKLAEIIGNFIAQTRPADVPTEAMNVARVGMIDTLGVLIAGAAESAPSIASRMTMDDNRTSASPIIPTGRLVSAADAALVNGTAAHVLDYDDVALNSHPSAVLVPAILAQGWSQDCGGNDALAAYVVGYECWAWITSLEPGALHDRGFHPTSVVGTIAAAAACAHLMRLDAEQATMAIAISASLASGLTANFGTMTKSFHAGRAAQNGVLAASLAKEGFTGSPDVLEHKSGFLRSHSPTNSPDIGKQGWDLGRSWCLPETGLHIKRYPICYATHRSIDGALALFNEHKVSLNDVAAIHVHTGAMQLLMLRNMQPQTGLEAKFSMPFAMAAALLAGKVGLNELSDEFVLRQDVQDTMRLVICSATEERDPTWDVDYAPFDQVTVTLKSGSILKGEQVTRPLGSWQKPMSKEDLRAKFLDCSASRLSQQGAARLFEKLWDLEHAPRIRNLALLSNQQH